LMVDLPYFNHNLKARSKFLVVRFLVAFVVPWLKAEVISIKLKLIHL
jgi:hypothetical protein